MKWFYLTKVLQHGRPTHLCSNTYLLTGMNCSFLFTCCTVLFCIGALLREGNPWKQCLIHTSCSLDLDNFLQRAHIHILACLTLGQLDYLHFTKYLTLWKGTTNIKTKQTAPKTAMMLHGCTFVHFLARHLLLNSLLLSSVVRAMQGLKVMPGSMALDKHLAKAKQDTHQTNSKWLIMELFIPKSIFKPVNLSYKMEGVL